MDIIGDVEGKTAVLVDDIIDTAGPSAMPRPHQGRER
jgi:phosphoribosylpyrophosphate synthetase